MEVRPRDLAGQMSQNLQPKIFTLPINAARLKAREILDQCPQGGLHASLRELAAASRRSD